MAAILNLNFKVVLSSFQEGFHDFKVKNNKFNVNVLHQETPAAVLEY